MRDWYNYDRETEEAELGKCVDDFCKELVALNEGRNLDCWPLCSFGWKDADLDACGCTGIKNIESANDEFIWIVVGGHKTMPDPVRQFEMPEEDREVYDEIALSIMMDQTVGQGEWDGDESWTLYHEVSVQVPWVFNDYKGELDCIKTAKEAKKLALKAIDPFEKDMIRLDEQMNKLYDELAKKYSS